MSKFPILKFMYSLKQTLSIWTGVKFNFPWPCRGLFRGGHIIPSNILPNEHCIFLIGRCRSKQSCCSGWYLWKGSLCLWRTKLIKVTLNIIFIKSIYMLLICAKMKSFSPDLKQSLPKLTRGPRAISLTWATKATKADEISCTVSFRK